MNNIPVVYEDEWLLIVDKPSGLLTVPTPKKEKRTLTSILNDEAKQKIPPAHVYPCHRLDRQTSGLIIYAKSRSMQQAMMEEFKQRRIKKSYIVFVRGRLSRPSGEITFPIEGRDAITRYRLLRAGSDFSVAEAHPLTGRTNQLRIHFARLGHPVLGEDKFAFRRDFRVKAKRLCLHALEVEFTHPILKRRMRVRAELPDYLAQLWNAVAPKEDKA
ncbi:MAG: RluA family pseudouridine synthase [Candidatus Omnitrophica bacterium]|nr:RluA family pseudouridine synthase [Candidatus Omnitrophota bacterium]